MAPDVERAAVRAEVPFVAAEEQAALAFRRARDARPWVRVSGLEPVGGRTEDELRGDLGTLAWGVLAPVRGGGARAPRPTPQEILRERFAVGEIDEAEFRERPNAL